MAAQHAIQLASQICVDIGAHLIAELSVGMPDERMAGSTDDSVVDPDSA